MPSSPRWWRKRAPRSDRRRSSTSWRSEVVARGQSQFGPLWRVFFAQFFSSESVTSDIQLRQTLIWVLAFLVTPGFMLSLQVVSRYAFAVYYQPSQVDRMTAALALIFI